MPKKRVLSLFITLCNKGWYYNEFILSLCTPFIVHSWRLQERRGLLLNDDVIVTWLFWKFWIFNNSQGKSIIKKHTPDYFLARKTLITCVEWSTPISISTFLPFLSKFRQKNQNCLFKMKFCRKSNSNMLNSLVMSTFFVLEQTYSFWANLIQQLKKVEFSNYTTFSIFFWANLVQKSKIQMKDRICNWYLD